MKKSLAILGAGRVGSALGRRLSEFGWKIGVVTATTGANARKAVRFIGAGRAEVGISVHALAAQTILLCVPDDEIATASVELAEVAGQALRGKVVMHTSGACGSDRLQALRECGAFVASMHPLQSFNGVSVPALEGKVFAIEGDARAVRVARSIARTLGGMPVNIDRSKKAQYHAAGVFAASMVLTLEESGVALLMAAGMKRTQAVRALLGLSRQVLENYEKLGPQKAWTGPLSRGDFEVVRAHEAALQEFQPEFLAAYQAVCRLTARVLAGDPAAMLQKLETMSGNASGNAPGDVRGSMPGNTKFRTASKGGLV
jgi:predicted short-subunit dehydrogenase-like oxidoreductase (DUF2520 family)